MTLYHGGKKRIGLEIAGVISVITDIFKEHDIEFNGYCEPFVGMAGVYRHIPEKINVKTYLAGDANQSLIKLWSDKKRLVAPKVCSESLFKKYKNFSPSPLKGFIGHACAFRGVYFGSFAYGVTQKRLQGYADEINRLKTDLKKVKFKWGEYDQFSNLKNYIIYCDPPYEKQSIYYDETHKLRKFDHSKFWDWCRKMSNENLVLVSEYSSPKDWIPVYKKDNEKVFIYKRK